MLAIFKRDVKERKRIGLDLCFNLRILRRRYTKIKRRFCFAFICKFRTNRLVLTGIGDWNRFALEDGSNDQCVLGDSLSV